ncbi:MAG TPA: class I SAM-dependent methyltransferase [Mycobacteriales bacterium]|nr:class I SAM-dependent methyltransferase [Mycobacteriales bacterium]
MTPGQRISFDRAAGYYDETRGGVERGGWNADLLGPWLSSDGTVLEVGVGTGLVAAVLTERGQHVVGVDLSAPMLQRAADRLPGRVAAADAQRLPIRDGAVAAAYFVHVLHLVADLDATLREARRVVRDGGRVLAIGIAPHDPSSDIAQLVEPLRRALHGPRPDDPDRVITVATAAGLRLEHRAEARRPAAAAPAEVADMLERRIWAWTWDIDDATWARLATPVLEQLRALPEPQRPREVYDARTLLVFTP